MTLVQSPKDAGGWIIGAAGLLFLFFKNWFGQVRAMTMNLIRRRFSSSGRFCCSRPCRRRNLERSIDGMAEESDGFERKPLLVITDFDGTLSLTDVGYEVLLKFSSQDWDDIDRAYCAGEIGSKEAYGRICAILGGTRELMLQFVAEHTVIDPHFREFYAFCREHDIDVKVVSDGLEFYIDFVLRAHGLSDIPFYSNVMTFRDGKPLAIEFPHANEDCNQCGTCKSNILESCQAGYGKIVYVGDGYSDLCPARKADLVFAKGILWTRLSEKEQRGVRKYRTFRDVKDFLSKNGFQKSR